MDYNSEKGVIFNIQKFSINDGDGVRTTVFFKGCPLKCKWCSNPESQSPNIQILWDKEKCEHCGACVAVCHKKAVSFSENRLNIAADCDACEKCVRQCPCGALKPEGKVKTVAEIVDVCMEDVDFYEESGGGVTLSGGEALMQPDFCIALLKALKDKNINAAIETTGFANHEVFAKASQYVDLFLFDVKHWNEQKHIEGTGVSNKLILQNMKYAIASGKNVLPRIPVIPGFNNSLDDAKGFAKLLKEVGARRAQLLPFHQFGENKYDLLGKNYEYKNAKALSKDDLQEFAQVFKDNNIDAFF